MTVYDALEQLQRITAHVDDPIPEDWYSTQQLADAKGVSMQRMHLMLMKALSTGKAQRRQFRVNNTRPTWFWHFPE